jgi:hypothetical protein
VLEKVDINILLCFHTITSAHNQLALYSPILVTGLVINIDSIAEIVTNGDLGYSNVKSDNKSDNYADQTLI